ncbi:hypothetical protein EJB05_28140, partial [Eragrostis curvula]
MANATEDHGTREEQAARTPPAAANANATEPPAASNRRKRGRPSKPPTPPTAANVDADITDLTRNEKDKSVADWGEENLRIVCELFAHEVDIGNRSSTHLSTGGYLNVMKRFKDITGISYTRKQFKNKWDKLKQDHTIWKKLTKQTGLGWDETEKNIKMPDEWWSRMAKQIKGSGRFKHQGLQHEDKLDIIDVPPSQVDENDAIDLDNDEENEDSDDDFEELPTPTSGATRRANVNDKQKKPKTIVRHWLKEQFGVLMGHSERTTTSAESVARKVEETSVSITDAMQSVRECGATPGTREFFIASIELTKASEREMFMTLKTPEERFGWLKDKHEWMTRNDLQEKLQEKLQKKLFCQIISDTATATASTTGFSKKPQPQPKPAQPEPYQTGPDSSRKKNLTGPARPTAFGTMGPLPRFDKERLITDPTKDN